MEIMILVAKVATPALALILTPFLTRLELLVTVDLVEQLPIPPAFRKNSCSSTQSEESQKKEMRAYAVAMGICSAVVSAALLLHGQSLPFTWMVAGLISLIPSAVILAIIFVAFILGWSYHYFMSGDSLERGYASIKRRLFGERAI